MLPLSDVASMCLMMQCRYEKLVKDEIETDAEALMIKNVGKQDPKKRLTVYTPHSYHMAPYVLPFRMKWIA